MSYKIETVGSRGEGVVHMNGRRHFVPKAAPGDEVILTERGLELVPNSPQRVPPFCRHFESCGGCDFQHLSYADQLDWKHKTTEHWIQRSPLAALRSDFTLDLLPAPVDRLYRHRVRIVALDGRPAYRLPNSHDLLPLEECPVLEAGFFEAIQAKTSSAANGTELALSFDGEGLVTEEAYYEVESKKIFYSSETFTQPNPASNQKMLGWLKNHCGHMGHANRALDIFCGVGNFTAILENYFDEIIGIDQASKSIQFAKKNFPHHTWITGDAAHEFKKLQEKRQTFDYALLDPSRAGALELCRELSRNPVPRLTYISCQLDSLIRDLQALTKKGPYRIDHWTVADLLPQTRHIESLVNLSIR